MFVLEIIAVTFLIGYFIGYRGSRNEIDSLKRQLAQKASPAPVQPTVAQPVATAVPAAPAQVMAATAIQQTDLSVKPRQQVHVDNAVLLLYFGAFLFLSAVGLFLAFGGLDGALKSLLVAALVGVFYIGGLMLYHGSQRLKPAGMTFVGIGMVLLPFFGLSLHIYVFDRTAGSLVWALTSGLSIVLYIHALMSTRQAYVTYFLLGATLSLFESSVAITELPVYYYGWVMALTAMLFMLFARWRGIWPDLQESLHTSSGALVPISLLFSIFYVPQHGFLQLSLGFALGSLYYWLAAYLEKDSKLQAQLVGAADALTVATILLFSYHFTSDFEAVAIVSLLAAACQSALLVLLYVDSKTVRLHDRYLAAITACLPYVALIFAAGNALLFLAALAVLVVVHAVLYVLHKDGIYLAGSLLGIMVLPLVGGLFVAEPAWDVVLFTLIYGLIAVLFFGLRKLITDTKAASTLKTLFYFALATLATTALFAGLTASAVVFAVISASLIALSYFEADNDKRNLFGLGLVAQHLTGIFATIAFTGNGLEDQRQYLLPIILGAIGLIQYVAAQVAIVATPGRQRYLRYAAITATFMGGLSFMVFGESNLFMVLNVIILSCILYMEGNRDDSQNMRDVGLGVGFIALEWLLYLSGVRVFQVYTHIWAAFFGFLAAWRASLGQPGKEHEYTLLGLLILTVPLAVQALSAQGEFYGWLLIIEHVALLLLGMMLAKRLIVRWGLWVSVAAVLYQLRSLTFLAVGFLAVVLIIIAIRVLQKNNDQ